MTNVVDLDRTGISHARYSSYGYPSTAAWHHDDKGTLVPPLQQSWANGAATAGVRVTEGA